MRLSRGPPGTCNSIGRAACITRPGDLTQGRAPGAGNGLWPVGALRTSAAAVFIVLLSFAALAWLFMFRSDDAHSMTAGPGMGMGPTGNMGMADAGLAASMSLPLFLGMWVTMMVAMMFPSMAPMVVIYSRFSAIPEAFKKHGCDSRGRVHASGP